MRTVALLMVQPKQAGAEDMAAKSIVDRVVDRLAEVVKTATEAAVVEIKSASSVLAESSMQMAATATSYQDALTSKGSSPNPIVTAATLDVRARVREGVKLWQILIDACSCGDCILWGVSTAGLVNAANVALHGLEHAADHRFVSAHWLNNGGMVLEINSEAAIGWIGALVTRASFLGRFAPDSSVRERAFPPMVQFMPLYFKPDSDSEVRSVEKDNDLPAGSLLCARWIKPPYRRNREQMCSHIILVTSATEAANKILTNGLLVCQKRVYAKKCKKEPTHCLKCQGWDHLSYSCVQAFDTCATCAGRHKTANCSLGVQLRCVSCRMEGHASWSRFCPIFNHKCDELNGRLTENTMPYFPTDEPWTHVIKPPKPTLYPLPPASHHPGHPGHPPGTPRGQFRQSTLQFPHVQ